MKTRIEYMDGHRGLAILLVIGFHTFYRWSEILPYGNQFTNIVIFKEGWLGVQLFFLISGFVILMTLEKCQTIKEFILRRWLRLFPAMLICSIILFLSASYFPERPAGQPTLIGLVPGLTFTDPEWWRILFGFLPPPLEEAFWSLYVEFKFYVFAAIVYFWRGPKVLLVSLLSVYLLCIITIFCDAQIDNRYLTHVNSLLQTLAFKYFGWFAAGACFYLFVKTKKKSWFYIALAIALFCAMLVKIELIAQHQFDWHPVLAAMTISLLFACSLIYKPLQSILSHKLLLLYGFVSYPLYLTHENMMIAIIIQLNRAFKAVPYFLLPVLPILLLTSLAYIIASFLETPLRKALFSGFQYLSAQLKRA